MQWFNFNQFPYFTEKCDQEKRRKQLAEAFGIVGTKKSGLNYSDFLLYISQVSPFFVKTVEKKLSAFLNGPEEIFSFDSTDKVQRRILSEYSRYWGLKVIGYRDISSPMQLQKKSYSKDPSIYLSQASKIRCLEDGVIVDINDVMPTSTIVFSNIDYRTGPHTLKSALGTDAEECRIFRVDKETSVAIFGDKKTAERAMENLAGTEWKVKLLSESEVTPQSTKVTRVTSQNTRKDEGIQHSKQTEETDDDRDSPRENPFEVLNEDD